MHVMDLLLLTAVKCCEKTLLKAAYTYPVPICQCRAEQRVGDVKVGSGGRSKNAARIAGCQCCLNVSPSRPKTQTVNEYLLV